MDVNTIVFFVVLMVFSLGLGVSGFIGNKAEAYSPPSFSTRLLFAGVLIALILFVGLTQPQGEASDYFLSYSCFFLGSLFLLTGVLFVASSRARAFWWRLVRRKEQKSDRISLIFVSFLLSFAFFFAFFLFYPPFLSIG